MNEYGKAPQELIRRLIENTVSIINKIDVYHDQRDYIGSTHCFSEISSLFRDRFELEGQIKTAIKRKTCTEE